MRLSIMTSQRINLHPVTGENYHGTPTVGDAIEVNGRISIVEARSLGSDRNEISRSITIWSQDSTLQNYDTYRYDGMLSTSIVHHRDTSGNYNHTVIGFG